MRGRIVLLLAAALFTAGAGWAELHGGGFRQLKKRSTTGGSRSTAGASAWQQLPPQAALGLEAFPMGVTASGRAKGYAYWSVRCKNGKSYVVQIPPNVKSPVIVADCSVLNGTGKECFKKF